MEHKSLTDIPEGQLVKSLLRDPYWLPTLFGIAGFPKDPLYLRVKSSQFVCGMEIYITSTGGENKANEGDSAGS
jgi:hypothetical protein